MGSSRGWRHSLAGRAGICFAAVAISSMASGATPPALSLDVRSPTADKPQSKLWFARGSWWALLPCSTGPSLWQRTPAGWREHPGIRETLRGLPGRGDVWFEGEQATAVLVAGRTLAVIRLRPATAPADGWTAEKLASWQAPGGDDVETATIARDGKGSWWVAAPVAHGTRRDVAVWHSEGAEAWRSMEPLARGIGGDDICLVTPVPGGVGVIWSDQERDEVMLRRHLDAHERGDWLPAETIAHGGRTADDHLHAALGPDGTLWLATKNSVDVTGQSQLVLRVRSPDGGWRNLAYAPRETDLEPSRPVVIGTPDGSRVLLGHTIYRHRERFAGQIVFGIARLAGHGLHATFVPVISPDPALKSRVNDVTGPKGLFPAAGPWIVLASDAEGRVYEADLRSIPGPG